MSTANVVLNMKFENKMPKNAKILLTLTDLALATTVCPRCESKPGQECVTVPGGKKTAMHTSRLAPLVYAYSMDRKAE